MKYFSQLINIIAICTYTISDDVVDLKKNRAHK